MENEETIKLIKATLDKFRPFLIEKEEIFIDAEIKPAYRSKTETTANSKDEYRFVINEICSLGNVSQRFVKGFQVIMHAEQLDSNLRKALVKLIKGNKGKCPLSIMLVDVKNKFHVELSSHKYAVSVNGDFLNSLKMLGLSYNIVR